MPPSLLADIFATDISFVCKIDSDRDTRKKLIKRQRECLLEYCSLLCAGSSASHLAQLDAVEIKAFKIIGISQDEDESMGLSLCHKRQISILSVFYRLRSGLAPAALSVLCTAQVSAGYT